MPKWIHKHEYKMNCWDMPIEGVTFPNKVTAENVSNSVCLCISRQKPTDKYTFTSRYIINLKTDYQLLTILSGFHLQSTYIIHSLLYASQQPCEVGRITPIWQMKWAIWVILSQDGDAQIVTQVSENQFPVFSSFSSPQSKSLLSFPPTPLTPKKPPS